MVIDGVGMILEVDGVAHRVEQRFLPLGFRGESAVVCTPLGGRIHDFNVMTDRDLCSARVAVLRLAEGEARTRAAPVTGLLACLAGKVAVAIAGQTPLDLNPWDVVLFDGDGAADATIAADTHAALALASIGAP